MTKSDNPSELLPLVDDEGNVIGQAPRSECHSGTFLLHPVVHLHVFNNAGELYLQKRPDWKDIQPGKWDTAVGGHVEIGESIGDALMREAREELGLTDFCPTPLCRYIFQSDRERELVNAFSTVYDGVISPSEEVDGGRWWPRDEIIATLGKGVFTPNFEQEYRRLFMR